MKKGRVVSLLLALLLVSTFLPKTALAADGGKSLSAGTSVLETDYNTANAATVYFGGHTWRVIDYGSGKATLLAAEFIGRTEYDNSGNSSNEYGVSTLRTKVEEIANGFSSGEKVAITLHTLEGGNVNWNETGYDNNKISGATVESAMLWPLSEMEASSIPSELRSVDPNASYTDSNAWWLRTPGSSIHYAQYISTSGNVSPGGTVVHSVEAPTVHYNRNYGIRPAFYLNLNSVLFTSAATGGKMSGAEGADALKEAEGYTGTEWKLTIQDAAHTDFKVTPCVTADESAGTVTIPYSGAVTGDNEYISAIIKNSSGEIKYYGRVAKAATSGSVTINTNGKLESDDKLYIFNEQYNGDKATDFSSPLIEIDNSPAGHKWEWVTDKEPTCTETGIKHEECSLCHEKRNEGTEIPTREIDCLPTEDEEVLGAELENPSTVTTSAKTGDNNNIALYVLILICALAVMCFAIRKVTKNGK